MRPLWIIVVLGLFWLLEGVGGTCLPPPLRTLSGHSEDIEAVAFSPEGTFLASGSLDKTVRVWEVDTGLLIHTLIGHTAGVSSVAFRPCRERDQSDRCGQGNKLLASGSDDGTVRLWDVAMGKEIAILPNHNSFVTSLAFSPEGRLLAVGLFDGRIILWNLARKERVHIFSGHRFYIKALTFSPDNTLLYSGSLDGTVRVWNVRRGELLYTHPAHTSGAIALNPDGQLLAYASIDNTVRLLDTVSYKEVRSLSRSQEGEATGLLLTIPSVSFSPDGMLLAAGFPDGKITVWKVNSGRVAYNLEGGHTKGVWSVAFSPKGGLLASGSLDGTIILWNIKKGCSAMG